MAHRPSQGGCYALRVIAVHLSPPRWRSLPPGPLGLGRSPGAGSEDLLASTHGSALGLLRWEATVSATSFFGGPARPPWLLLPSSFPQPESSGPEVRLSPCQYSAPAAALASHPAGVPRRAPRPLGGRPAQPVASAPLAASTQHSTAARALVGGGPPAPGFGTDTVAFGLRAPAMAAPGWLLLRPRPSGLLLLLPGLLLPLAGSFNLDVESPAEYAGPEGSYFGFAVDFFAPSTSSMFLLVGAPKANTTQPGIVEGGQVLKCDCSSSRRCQPIEFDSTGNRDYAKDDPLEFKSHQWFGASVRSKQDKILMAAYFGFSVAATDINGDDYADVFIGAPLFMDRGSDGKLQEVGQVSVSLQRALGDFQTTKLNGFEVFARFGSAIAPLGDLDQDGFNDIAIAAPYGGEDQKGLVYIFNGRSTGLNSVPSQILEGQWAAQSMPPSFGYSMKGATDVDRNGYPDLVVGAFGVDRAILYRARPVVTVNAGLEVYPSILNQDNKICPLPGTSLKVSCFNVRFCLKADGKGTLPKRLNFQVELLLDKLKQKGAIRRALFLHNRSPGHSKNMTVFRGGQMQCEELVAYLRDESEFRDKLTPITIFMEYRLDHRTAADVTGLQPILNQFTPANVSRQAHILLDCGEDNVCKPKLEVSVDSDQKKIYIGDDNPLTLTVKAQNQGEGAYEAELIVSIPPQADFIGVVRNNELLAGLRFSVHQQSEMDTSVKFDLKIQSSNSFDNVSPVVSYKVYLAVLAAVEIRGVSSPDHIFLPIPNWEYKENPETEEDVGPVVQHIYELRNNGPSSFSKAILNLQWPYKYNNNTLLYILHYDIDGPMNCTADTEINPLRIKIPEKNDTSTGQGDRHHLITKRDLTLSEGDVHTLGCGVAKCLQIICQVGRLDRGKSAILYVKSLLWTETFMNKENQNHSYSLKSSASFNIIEFPYKNLPIEDLFNSTLVTTNITWGIQPAPMPVPVWVIIMAVLAGLLLLAVLVFVMYRMGFFKRVRPPQEEQEREQLQPHENGEGNSET
ncbi:integrin alpha V [Cricetulus griseus]